MRGGSHHPTEGRVTLTQVAAELAITRKRALKLLTRHGRWLGAHPRTEKGQETYDATVIEKLRGLLGQGHRQLKEADHDWLSDYLEGRTHG